MITNLIRRGLGVVAIKETVVFEVVARIFCRRTSDIPLATSSGNVKCSLIDLFFSIFGVVDRNLSSRLGDQNIQGVGERRTFLNQVVANELEGFALKKNDGFVIQRTIFEMKNQMIGDLIAMCDLRISPFANTSPF